VFCGFLAEYQLEHKIENQRGKQYNHSLYEDLVSDTARFSSIVVDYDKKIKGLEVASDCYHELEKNKTSGSCLIQLLIHLKSFRDIAPKDRTLQQLKNAGGYRLLDEDDADSVFLFDGQLAYSLLTQNLLQESQTNIRNTISLIFDVDLMNKVIVNRDSVIVNYTSDNILVTKDPRLVVRFFNELTIYRNRVMMQREQINKLQVFARSLILYLKDKYSY